MNRHKKINLQKNIEIFLKKASEVVPSEILRSTFNYDKTSSTVDGNFKFLHLGGQRVQILKPTEICVDNFSIYV